MLFLTASSGHDVAAEYAKSASLLDTSDVFPLIPNRGDAFVLVPTPACDVVVVRPKYLLLRVCENSYLFASGLSRHDDQILDHAAKVRGRSGAACVRKSPLLVRF